MLVGYATRPPQRLTKLGLVGEKVIFFQPLRGVESTTPRNHILAEAPDQYKIYLFNTL
ncbi:hypothetical protein L873DRAFT_1805351 [Choiromyces venosus 120613-1]|uniref:Uncharacterized protein n=1 Tax=Choiromyces venosus 120613-1 TaxID=1336337 RepID=A0A3N4JWF4_9PEZI|nr:hypothetical protein L873DRAFT_1805351 [Choiromyces venosus 120613-1]